MFWLVFAALGAVFIACLSFALGAAVGASSSQGQFVNVVLPALGAMGGWVSGIGALAAVLATLWLADRQRREDVEKLKVSASSMIITGESGWFIGVNIVSTGRRPALVTSVSFSTPASSKQLVAISAFPGSSSLPARLNYGEQSRVIYGERLLQRLADFLNEEGDGKTDLEVSVSTTTEVFSSKLSKELVALISACASKTPEQAAL